MSRENTATRILEAALGLLRKRGNAGVTMAEIAKVAKISRQAVYLHFADRGALLAELARYVDAKRGLAKEIQKVTEAADGMAALRELAAMQARTNPEVWAVARAVDAVRRTDGEAERAWQDRMQHRLAGMRQIAHRLHDEGQLRASLTTDAAADLMWTITSLRTWEELVLERGWTAAQYETRIADLLTRALTGA